MNNYNTTNIWGSLITVGVSNL